MQWTRGTLEEQKWVWRRASIILYNLGLFRDNLVEKFPLVYTGDKNSYNQI